MGNGVYIYGIIQTDSPQAFGNIGIGPDAPDVQTLVFHDIAAVISSSPFTAYDSLAKDHTIKALVTHQSVIEKVMKHFTILPVKFGTMVESVEQVMKFLEQGYTLLNDELRKMAGKTELDVVATWQLPKILPTMYRRNSQIQNKQKEVALKGAGASVEDKVELGKLIEQSLGTEKAHYHELLLQTLKENSLDVCMHDPANDEMIFNAAFLLYRQDIELFHQHVYNLDQRLEDTVNFRVVGPLPPYSFSTILLECIDSRKLEEARAILDLRGALTDKTVRDAYRQLAQRYHPDASNGGNIGQFRLAHTAYTTLKHFIEDGQMHVAVYRWEKDML